MILLREIQEKDLEALERFAQIPGLINLPNDRELLQEKIKKSIQSFYTRGGDFRRESKFIFVAEDLSSGRVVGTSMVAAQHGTAESPHFYFEVGSEKKFSETISTGFIHGTLQLKFDSDGPSEIGGLVMDPDFRNTEAKVGRQISFIRFLFMGLNRGKFKKKIISELLPPLNKRGQSPLWEAIGRRFTNMDYWEADALCQKNKEFIFSLFPAEKIYTTFLPAEARNAIGKVGKETEPVVHMLQKIGFKYPNQVDPFDGGPHFWVDVEEIVPIKKLAKFKWDLNLSQKDSYANDKGLVCKTVQASGCFRAVSAHVILSKDRGLSFLSPEASQVEAVLGLNPGDDLDFMPFY